MGQHKAQRPNDVRGLGQQHFALLQGFTHKAEIVVFKVAQAAMDQFGAGRRCGTGQVVLLEQHHAQTARAGIGSYSSAVDTAADNGEFVVRFRHGIGAPRGALHVTRLSVALIRLGNR